MDQLLKIMKKKIPKSNAVQSFLNIFSDFLASSENNCSTDTAPPAGVGVAIKGPTLLACLALIRNFTTVGTLTHVGKSGGANESRKRKREFQSQRVSFDRPLGSRPTLNGPASGQQMASCQLPHFAAFAGQKIVKRYDFKALQLLKKIQ